MTEQKKPFPFSVWMATSPNSNKKDAAGKSMKKILEAWNENAIPVFERLPTDGTEAKISKPGKRSLAIADIQEKAYQRAYFVKKKICVVVDDKEKFDVEWLDIEVPVVQGGKARRLCLDMIGRVGGKNTFVIGELKGPHGTSPFYAIKEVLSYACHVCDNHARLESHPAFHKDTEIIEVPSYWPEYEGEYLIVGAPSSYWGKWAEHKRKIKAVGAKWLAESGLQGHRLLMVEYPDEDFKSQREGPKKYVPCVLNGNDQWGVVYEIQDLLWHA
jgi:hypothetical protein